MTERRLVARDSKVGRIAKAALPYLTRVFTNRFAIQAVRYNEIASCMIQGKGSGSGWDLSSEVTVAAEFVKTKTPVLVDVGANWGDWSSGMLKVFPGCSKLLLVEPQPKCLEGLARIDFCEKLIFACAVADASGQKDFYTAEEAESWSCASLFERTDTYFSDVKQRKFGVAVRTLDEIILESGVAQIDFMKMDVEGAELLALMGAGASLQAGKIRALSFEFGSGNVNSRTFFRDFWDFLGRYDFSIFRILPGGGVLKIERYDEDLEYFRGATNYVASLV